MEGRVLEVPELITSSLAEFAEKYPDIESRTFYLEGSTEKIEKNAALLRKVGEEYQNGIVQHVYLATLFNGETGKLIVTSPQFIVTSDFRFINVATPFFKVLKDVIINEDGTFALEDAKYVDYVDTSKFATTAQVQELNNILSDEINGLKDSKQDTLVSGTNIKTINGESILGSGNMEITSGGPSYDDTELNNKLNGLQTQIDTLVSGNASTAIESFNEITAFLNGVEDTESLDGIIAGIEQQITNKQDIINDLDAIRSGATLGATALQEHQDISHLATKDELTSLTNEMIANEEVTAAALNELNERVNEINENVSGETATKVELQTVVESLTNTILENEEITASALNDLNTRLNEILTKLNNAGL